MQVGVSEGTWHDVLATQAPDVVRLVFMQMPRSDITCWREHTSRQGRPQLSSRQKGLYI